MAREGKLRVSLQERAGLALPVTALKKRLKQVVGSGFISKQASVAMVAIDEFLMLDLFDRIADYVVRDQRKKVTPEHIRHALMRHEYILPLLEAEQSHLLATPSSCGRAAAECHDTASTTSSEGSDAAASLNSEASAKRPRPTPKHRAAARRSKKPRRG